MRCPKGTPQQILANLSYLKSANAEIYTDRDIGVEESYTDQEEQRSDAEDFFSTPEEDVIRADERCPPTTEDEIVYLFVNFFMELLLKWWDGTPCLKPKLAYLETPSEVAGEETISLDYSNISADDLNKLYKSRSQKLAGDRFQMGGRPVCTRDSIANEAESGEGETIASDAWKLVLPDEDVDMELQNGVRYRGRVSRRLMDGNGTFFWADGGSYEGEFIGGAAIGHGRLLYPDENIYEGQIFRGFRHGVGLHCMARTPVMYSGDWWLGKKNGHGLIIYQDPSRHLDFYQGLWENNKEGFGYRQYPSGSRYVGFWSKGRRHGMGTMFWSNNDIYRGQWKDGLMHGFGVYTWNGFVNKTFSYPRLNRYRGFWAEGKRHGCGVLEMSNGCLIETVWVNGEKEGPGTAVCCNGFVITAENMFKRNKPALLNEEESLTGLLFRNRGSDTKKKKSATMHMSEEDLMQMMAYVNSVERAKSVSIPIHTPVHCIDLGPHLKRLHDQKNELNKKQTRFLSIELEIASLLESVEEIPPEELDVTEEKLLRYSIMMNLIRLRWSAVACSETPPFSCVLLRIFFWELLTQSRVPTRNFSLIDIDNILDQGEFLVDSPHYPFEKIQFWQFIHYLITISWYLYGQYVHREVVPSDKRVDNFLNIFSAQSEKAVLSSAFEHFLANHIFDIQEKSSDIFKRNNLVPIDGMYLEYKNVGEPHSAKKFLTAVCVRGENERPLLGSFFERLPQHKRKGVNTICIADEICYLPKDKGFNHPELPQIERETQSMIMQSSLSKLSPIGPKGVVECLVSVCPNIVEDGLIVDMDHQLTFLEFYKVVIACAEMLLRKKALKEMQSKILSNSHKELEEYERSMKDYEIQKESPATKKTSKRIKK